ncbi:MAG: hybrid sensor histidine kinase/response regulator [Chthoniobacteraceae bacterium]
MPPSADLHERLLTAFRAESAEQIAEMRRILELPAPTSEELDEAFRFAHSMKGGARVCDLVKLEAAAHDLETELAALRSEGRENLPKRAATLRTLLDGVEDLARQELHGPREAIAEQEEEIPARSASASAGAGTVRIATGHLDQLLSISGRLLAELLPQDRLREELDGLTRTLSELDRDLAGIREDLRPHGAGVELPVLSRLEEWRQQLVESQRQARRITSLQMSTQNGLRALSQEFTREINLSRLVAASAVFEGFGTMVRDLARESGKEVNFRAEGLDTMADRSVLQSCKDPVMHLLRNALVHGIEAPDRRERAGKPRVATVELRVETRGQRLHIIVEDDGAGIPLERIRRLAVERGIRTFEAMQAMNDQDLLQLIFQAGLSTAENLSEVAGRGMGLSVVDSTVRRLGGSVLVHTEPGQGTRFDLETSLTISAQHLILASAGEHRIGIPSANIVRLLRVRADQLAPVEGHLRYSFKDQSLPVISLAAVLGVPAIANDVEGGSQDAIIIRSRERLLCLLVDDLHEQREAVVHELDGPAALPLYAGAAMMESGALIPVLHVAELFAPARAHRPSSPHATAPASIKRQQRVLVVDDSFTTRTLERSILEAHGYRVTVAVDGVEALARLRSEAVDLVISDIQMPRMDGFTLVTEIKADAKLKQTPVILVSSMESPEDQERGLTAGAEAYIVKRKFDHEELIATIRQLL